MTFEKIFFEVVSKLLTDVLIPSVSWLVAYSFRRTAPASDDAPITERPFKVLVAAARPWDAPPVDALGIWKALCQAIQELPADTQALELTYLPRATTGTLQAALKSGCDALFFIGHGTEEGQLVLEDDYGLSHHLTAQDFAGLLPTDGRLRPRLVLLMACHSGKVGEALQGTGVPHVVAIDAETPIPVQAAARYVVSFLKSLAAGSSVGYSHEDGVSAAKLDKYTGDRSPLVEGPPVSRRFELLFEHN